MRAEGRYWNRKSVERALSSPGPCALEHSQQGVISLLVLPGETEC